jgi:hypothetical protein
LVAGLGALEEKKKYSSHTLRGRTASAWMSARLPTCLLLKCSSDLAHVPSLARADIPDSCATHLTTEFPVRNLPGSESWVVSEVAGPRALCFVLQWCACEQWCPRAIRDSRLKSKGLVVLQPRACRPSPPVDFTRRAVPGVRRVCVVGGGLGGSGLEGVSAEKRGKREEQERGKRGKRGKGREREKGE